MDQAAFIVSAKNATVITAMDRTEAKDQLFTNIDGTIVLTNKWQDLIRMPMCS